MRTDEATDTRAADTGAAHSRTGGSGDDHRASVRRCVVTRAVRPKAELLRFVIDPDGAVVPDLAATLPGRGVWVSSRREALDKACKANMFARSAKTTARIPDDLAARVESMLARRCVELLGLARRASQAVGGYEKVRDWVARGRAGLLIEAVDGAADGRAKMTGAARGAPMLAHMTAEELGAAFGRDRTVHVAVAAGGFAKRLQDEMHRLAGFRRGGEGK